MKPFGQEKRPKDWLPIVNFAMVEGIPRSLNLRDHLFPYVGSENDRGFIWGVYGTTSINMAIYAAAQVAARSHRRALQLTSWIRVDDFHNIPNQQTEDTFASAAYLHLGRTSSGLRSLIREKWLGWVRSNHAAHAEKFGEHLGQLSLADLAAHFPGYARVLLTENPHVRALIHPVTPEFSDGKPGAHTWVLTAPYDKEYIMASEVRFVADVEISLW